MGQTYQQNKKHIMKWRENNPTQWRIQCRATSNRYYHWSKIKKEFFNILLMKYI